MPPIRYKSNLEPLRDLEPFFQHARPIDNPNARHVSLCDPEIFKGCGYATHDEAAILQHLAIATNSVNTLVTRSWLEIGTHTGWTAAHIADVGTPVLALDPEYKWPGHNITNDPVQFYTRTRMNLVRCGLDKLVTLCGMTSNHLLDEPGMYVKPEHHFAGVFIDGNHSDPAPTRDAGIALRFVHFDGMIVFHDVVGEPIQSAVRFLCKQGWQLKLYRTPQVIAALKRPTSPIVFPKHTPDPAIDFAELFSTNGIDSLTRFEIKQ